MLAYDLIAQLAPLARHFSSDDYDRAIDALSLHLDFEIHHFTQKDDHNGWMLPPRHSVRHATIHQNGKLFYNGECHPLAVKCHSTSFKGDVLGEELKLHCLADPRHPEWIPYEFRASYRPWNRSWGFCMPAEVYDTIMSDAVYHVDLQVEDGPAEIKVLSYLKKGQSDKEFVFCAHLDHPGMANDDLAGCAVAVQAFQKLAGRETSFSYRLLIVQEIIGSQYFLRANDHTNMLGGVFLEMLGADTPISLQSSALGTSKIERLLEERLKQQFEPLRKTPFRTLVGNDEIVFESFGVPMCSLIRFPYPEYHSSADNIGIISRSRLEEAIALIEELFDSLEKEVFFEKQFSGVPCLANPKYDLYVDHAELVHGHPRTRALFKMMNSVPVLRSGVFLSDFCDEHDLEMDAAAEALRQWRRAGLVVVTGNLP